MELNALTISGVIITILIGVVGFFVSRLINDVKHCMVETGRNKGRIDLIAKQQENDVKRIENTTQLEIKALAQNVHVLSNNVHDLVVMMAEHGIKKK